MPTLHSLPFQPEFMSPLHTAHGHLEFLVSSPDQPGNSPIHFELTPPLIAKLETEFFHGPIPASLLAAEDWRIRVDTSPGWEILRLNEICLELVAGVDRKFDPSPIPLEDHRVQLHEDADLAWLANWPGIRRLHVPHSVNDLGFLKDTPELRTLTLADIYLVEDFTPLSRLAHLRSLHVYNGEDLAFNSSSHVIAELKSLLPNLVELGH